MPILQVNGVELHCEVRGAGTAIVLLHELAMDAAGWHAQIAFFARRHRVIAFNARGFPPSSVPADKADYGHEQLVADVGGVMDALGVERAFLVGHGTGGNIAMGFALDQPKRVRGLVLAGSGAGYGNPGWKDRSSAFSEAVATNGMKALSDSIAKAPQRQPFARKDPQGFAALLAGIARLSPVGIANLMANGVRNRPSYLDLKDAIAQLAVPVLAILGDNDLPAFEASVFVARTAPHAGLAVLPDCGHTLPVEEPALFNQIVGEFFSQVREGRWGSWTGDPET